MQDEFDKKRDVVKSLMDMLRSNAVSEVEGPKKMASVEKISVSPEAEAMIHPDAAAHGDSMPMEDEMHDDMEGMADGGMAMASDEPMREMVAALPAEDSMGNEGVPCEPETPMEEQDEDNNSSAFSAFMKRKKK